VQWEETNHKSFISFLLSEKTFYSVVTSKSGDLVIDLREFNNCFVLFQLF